jgi:hypothetical protein
MRVAHALVVKPKIVFAIFSVQHTWEREEMEAKFWLEILKGNNQMGALACIGG